MTNKTTPLRVAAPNEKPTRAKTTKPRTRRSTTTKTVTQAATKGTTRELLVAMRDRIAKSVEAPETQAKDLAALTNRLMQIVREIETIDAREGQEDASRANTDEDGTFDASAV